MPLDLWVESRDYTVDLLIFLLFLLLLWYYGPWDRDQPIDSLRIREDKVVNDVFHLGIERSASVTHGFSHEAARLVSLCLRSTDSPLLTLLRSLFSTPSRRRREAKGRYTVRSPSLRAGLDNEIREDMVSLFPSINKGRTIPSPTE